jgi:hypothetical protein
MNRQTTRFTTLKRPPTPENMDVDTHSGHDYETVSNIHSLNLTQIPRDLDTDRIVLSELATNPSENTTPSISLMLKAKRFDTDDEDFNGEDYCMNGYLEDEVEKVNELSEGG